MIFVALLIIFVSLLFYFVVLIPVLQKDINTNSILVIVYFVLGLPFLLVLEDNNNTLIKEQRNKSKI